MKSLREKLKPCPKCKSDLLDIQSSRRMGVSQIDCTDCGYGISIKGDEEQAISAWNRRVG